MDSSSSSHSAGGGGKGQKSQEKRRWRWRIDCLQLPSLARVGRREKNRGEMSQKSPSKFNGAWYYFFREEEEKYRRREGKDGGFKKTSNGKFPRMGNRVEGAEMCSFGLYARSVQIMPSHSQPYFQFLVSPFPRSRNWRLGSDDDYDDKRGRMDLERRGRKGREKTLISAESSFLFRPPLENRTEGRGRILRV